MGQSLNWLYINTFRQREISHNFADLFENSRILIQIHWNMVPNIELTITCYDVQTLQWRHDGRDGVSNHQRLDCLPDRLFGRRSKKTSKLRVTGLCEGNSPGNSPHKGPVTRNMFPFYDVIMEEVPTSFHKQYYREPKPTPLKMPKT